MTLEIFVSPGCGKCGQTKQQIRQLITELSDYDIQFREVDILDEMDRAVALGILSTPSIAINGELVFTSAPSMKTLRIKLEHLQARQ